MFVSFVSNPRRTSREGKNKGCCCMFSCVHALTRNVHFENIDLYQQHALGLERVQVYIRTTRQTKLINCTGRLCHAIFFF